MSVPMGCLDQLTEALEETIRVLSAGKPLRKRLPLCDRCLTESDVPTVVHRFRGDQCEEHISLCGACIEREVEG